MTGVFKKNILILGGARSGKSALAQNTAAQIGGKVLFCATAEALDEEMKSRIDEHKLSRPPGWDTLEAPSGVGRILAGLEKHYDVIVIDCITILIANVMSKQDANKDVDSEVAIEIDGLLEFMGTDKSSCILVSNEVGLGLVPDNRMGRIYRDILGRVNQRLAQHADEVYFMAAGLPLKIK
ncbi:MAG: bifunctional adenosylcobinamide kinase/adenosylcobinamide-phosphate guanylyltransferase [Dehalococcoidia bacterium]|nr:bifunctional adenosylcobinamide kinase/adenosylcobinamide-phosphate guanylyltransferase [Dehalococcoidia bacterium]MDD5493118.1 bifunctional adenosylcobinamide kinase/adenosylcobinamide-phosphate guanylyltransferase [Dehalococcoidia bacterium]